MHAAINSVARRPRRCRSARPLFVDWPSTVALETEVTSQRLRELKESVRQWPLRTNKARPRRWVTQRDRRQLGWDERFLGVNTPLPCSPRFASGWQLRAHRPGVKLKARDDQSDSANEACSKEAVSNYRFALRFEPVGSNNRRAGDSSQRFDSCHATLRMLEVPSTDRLQKRHRSITAVTSEPPHVATCNHLAESRGVNCGLRALPIDLQIRLEYLDSCRRPTSQNRVNQTARDPVVWS